MYYEEPKMEILILEGKVFTDLINNGSMHSTEDGPTYGFDEWT